MEVVPQWMTLCDEAGASTDSLRTPGRLNDHLDKGNLNRYHIRYLVIDEFDKCLENGFQDEMSRLVRMFRVLRRHFLLSATEAEEISRFRTHGAE